MNTGSLSVLLADDDEDDCMFFKDALNELPVRSSLKTVFNGDQLMHLLISDSNNLPDILFLDLNMPRKTGIECLSEIKLNKKLSHIPVIIYSTSHDPQVVQLLYEKGAQRYIRKPGEFSQLKKVILEALSVTSAGNAQKVSKENFVIQV